MKKTLLILTSLLIIVLTACSNTKQTMPEVTQSDEASRDIILVSDSPIIKPMQSSVPKPTKVPMQTTTPVPTVTPKYDFIGQVVCTAIDYVNIRKGPSTDSEILGRFSAGDVADVIENSDNWVNIYYENMEGFVHIDYTVASSSPSVQVPAGDWTSILINPTHLLPDDYVLELSDFEGGQINAHIFEIAIAMFEDAADDGIELLLVDAYRSFETQAGYYEAKVKTYIDKGYSRADAEVKAATITARPNTSEHQTGLALDIVTPSYTRRNSGYADTLAFKWLYANGYKYGFIMRYPRGKEDITKVIFEPWHWRFVGVQTATAIKQSGQCFEEYLGVLD